MAEYWKSTPKYWCKFCQTYIRDTKFERQQHEATGKHQSAIQRSLRDLHRTRELEDRERQRAKDEVARLNGLTSSSSTTAGSSAAGAKGKKPEPPRQASAEERKRQLKQLADMGVAVPDEFRGEMALAGEWQTVAVKSLASDAPSAYKDANLSESGALLNVGVRNKRKAEEEIEEEEALEALSKGERKAPRRAGWGNSFKAYPGAKGGDPGDDIEALLSGAKKVKTEEGKTEEDADEPVKKEESAEDDGVKKEEGDEDVKADPVATEPKLSDIPPVKTEEDAPEAKEDTGAGGGGVVFKKRKGKTMRQK